MRAKAHCVIRNGKMKSVILVVVLLATLAAHESVTVNDIDSAIGYLTRGVPANPMQREPDSRTEMARAILTAARETELDPYLLVVMAYRESSFRHWAIGKAREEVGVAQIHGKPLRDCIKDGLDMARPSGQAMCGARYLRQLSDYCGSTTRGLSAYASGSCNPRTKRTQQIVVNRLRLAQKLAGRPWEYH